MKLPFKLGGQIRFLDNGLWGGGRTDLIYLSFSGSINGSIIEWVILKE